MKKGLKQMTVEAMQADQDKIIKSAKRQPVKKSKVKAPKLFPVAVEDMKIGMTISDHGTVTAIEPFTGRARIEQGKGKKKRTVWKTGAGLKGFLFKTTDHLDGCFYEAGMTVWCIR